MEYRNIAASRLGSAPAGRRQVVLALGALLCGAFAASVSFAEEKSLRERLIGSWQFVSTLNLRKDGTRFDRWGSDARGIFVFDNTGHYVQMITNTDRMFGPRAVSSFGTYTVDEASKTIITKIEASSSPKTIGTTQRRVITLLTDDELKYTNSVTPSGTTVEAVWRRYK